VSRDFLQDVCLLPPREYSSIFSCSSTRSSSPAGRSKEADEMAGVAGRASVLPRMQRMSLEELHGHRPAAAAGAAQLHARHQPFPPLASSARCTPPPPQPPSLVHPFSPRPVPGAPPSPLPTPQSQVHHPDLFPPRHLRAATPPAGGRTTGRPKMYRACTHIAH